MNEETVNGDQREINNIHHKYKYEIDGKIVSKHSFYTQIKIWR